MGGLEPDSQRRGKQFLPPNTQGDWRYTVLEGAAVKECYVTARSDSSGTRVKLTTGESPYNSKKDKKEGEKLSQYLQGGRGDWAFPRRGQSVRERALAAASKNGSGEKR